MKRKLSVLWYTALMLTLIFGVVQFSSAGEGSTKGTTQQTFYGLDGDGNTVVTVHQNLCGSCNGGVVEWLLSQCRCVDSQTVIWH